MLSQELVDGESDGLAGGDTHDTGGDALVKGVETFLPIDVLVGRPNIKSRPSHEHRGTGSGRT
jgi:hypothetical protein